MHSADFRLFISLIISLVCVSSTVAIKINGFNGNDSIDPFSFNLKSWNYNLTEYRLMASLAADNRTSNVKGYFSYDGAVSNNTYDSGWLCENKHNFNGYSFGKFYCPLPGFDQEARYCCGDSNQSRQFCCKYWEDSRRAFSTVIVVAITILAIVILVIYETCLLLNRRESKRHRAYTSVDNPSGL